MRLAMRSRISASVRGLPYWLAGPAFGARSFETRRFLNRGFEAAELVGDADEKHGLTCCFEDVDDAFWTILQVNSFTVGEEVHFGVAMEGFAEFTAHFAVEVAYDAADALEGEAVAAEFSDDGNFDDFVRLVHAAVTVLLGGDDVLLIPPLQLPETYTGYFSDFATGENFATREDCRSTTFCA